MYGEVVVKRPWICIMVQATIAVPVWSTPPTPPRCDSRNEMYAVVSSREAKKFFDMKCSLRISSKESGNESPDSRPAGSYAKTKNTTLAEIQKRSKNKNWAKKSKTRCKTRGSITISRESVQRWNAVIMPSDADACMQYSGWCHWQDSVVFIRVGR